jgi:hypothetical protein
MASGRVDHNCGRYLQAAGARAARVRAQLLKQAKELEQRAGVEPVTEDDDTAPSFIRGAAARPASLA